MEPDYAPTAALAEGAASDDPLPDTLVALPGAWTRDTDTDLDEATIGRLQEAARQSRDRIARRLAGADLATGAPAVAELDTRRVLDDGVDDDVETLQHIDELHRRRRGSASPRERQRATTVLAEALHRIIDGYRVGQPPESQLVRRLRRIEDATGRIYSRLTVFREWSPQANWWEERGRWVLLGLGIGAAVLVGLGYVVAAATLVIVRALVATITAAPRPPDSSWRRLAGFSPDQASSLCRHAGDTAILGGIAIVLQLNGRPAWAAVTTGAAVVGLLATMSRLSGSCEGLRMPQLWIERAAKDMAFSGALVAAVVVGAGGLQAPVPVHAAAPAAVAALGITELIRDAYYGRRRRHVLTRAAAADPLVPNAIVVTTGDAIVVNLCRSRPRPTLFGDATDNDSRDRLRVVEAAD